MAPTLEDLFEFMKNDKEERAKERERDKQEIKELISEGVKQEVRSLIQPIQERVKSLETVKDEVLDKLKVMSDQIKDIKEQAQERKDETQPVTYANALQSTSLPRTPSDPNPAPRNQAFNDSEKQKALEVLDLARRTVSLYPFRPKDIEFESKRGAKDNSEAMLWAVQTFLRYEMNIKPEVLATFSIENIFAPSVESWDTLYVTLSSITEANTIYSYTRNMRKEVTVGIYVPNEWKGRFRALSSLAHSLRNPAPDSPKYSTRIKWGATDLVLYKKLPGTRYWSIVTDLPPLPPVDLCAVGPRRLSPAPGRQAKDPLKRQRSSGNSSDSDSGTSQRNVRPRDELVEDVPGSPVVKPAPDLGRVTGEESYCPASPAPVKTHPALPDHLGESPVFKKATPTSFRMNPLVI